MTATLTRGPLTTASASAASEWPRIGVTPAELIHKEGSLRLLRYRPTVEATPGTPPFLLVMPLINRSYIVDLTPATSLIAALQAAGVDVFMIDWGRSRLADRTVGLDQIVTGLLPRCEKRVLRASGAESLVLAGYCLGGTIATCRAAHAAAKDPTARHAGLVTFHAPVAFDHAGVLGTFTKKENFPVEALLGAFGNMPGWLLQQGFTGQKPLQHVQKYRKLHERLAPTKDPKKQRELDEHLEEFIALERWNSDNVPVTGAFYERLIKDLYRDDQLAHGKLAIHGTPISLDAIRCPTLVIVAEDDPICLPHQATALADKASSSVKEVERLSGGHVRSLTSPKHRHKVAARVAKFLTERRPARPEPKK